MEISRLFGIIGGCYMTAVILGTLGGLYKWHYLNTMMRLAITFIIYTLLQELSSLFLPDKNHKTEILDRLFSIAEITIPLCCYLAFRGWLIWKYAIIITILSLGIVLIRYHYFNSDHARSYFIAVEQFIFSIIAAHALYRIMISDKVIVWHDPVFAFWTAQLIGCAGTYMLFSISPIARKHADLLINIQLLNAIINTLIYAFMAYAILTMPVRKQES